MPVATRHLFSCWNEVAQRIRRASAIALFLDFDGTLSPLCPRPEDVHLSGATRNVVATLARKSRIRVWVISGRRRADVRDRSRIGGVQYLGLHGWEGRQELSIEEETRRLLDSLKARARQIVQRNSTTWLEDKGVVATIHHAKASVADVTHLRQEMTCALQPLNGRFRGIAGERSFEIMPSELGDKGTAVRHELAIASRAALPVFVGDDAVDEPAFAALTNGITIRVGRPSFTHARFRLAGVKQVRMFLERLNREVGS
ncbi:MAG: trehalose-phosphatase [Acidobacteriia bacterium]|nr:trehalose-phosphatase [Terriglobia bacterium]